MVKGEAAGSYANITIDALILPQNDIEGKGMSSKAKERIRVDIVNI